MKTQRAMLLAATLCVVLGGLISSPLTAREFRYGTSSDVVGLDPHANNFGVTNAMKVNIYEGLVRRLPDGSVEPGLATHWERIAPTVWRFQLRPDVKFHGGEDFTATDVLASFERVRQPSSEMAVTVGSIEEIKVLGPHEIQIVTKGPNPVLLQDLTMFFIMSKTWIERNKAFQIIRTGQAGAATNYANLNANGTGPFRVVERVADERTVLEPFAGWWDKAEHGITRAIFRPIASGATRVAALLSGELDLMYHVPLQDVPRIQNGQGTRVVQGPTARTIYLAMDVASDELQDMAGSGKNPLKDVRVRRAIYHAIDNNTIQRVILRNSTTPAGLVIAPTIQGFAPELNKRPPYNLEEAKRLLADAGYAKGFPLTLTCPNNRYINDEQICTAVVAMLQKAGIHAKLNAIPFGQFMQAGFAGKNQFYMIGWTPNNFDITNPVRELLSMQQGAGSNNWGKYSNPKVDELRAQIGIEVDMAKRQALSSELWRVVQADVPIVPLHQEPQIFGLRDVVSNFTMRAQEDVELRFVRMKP